MNSLCLPFTGSIGISILILECEVISTLATVAATGEVIAGGVVGRVVVAWAVIGRVVIARVVVAGVVVVPTVATVTTSSSKQVL